MPASLDPFLWPLGEGDTPPGQPPPGVEILGHDGGTFLIARADGSVVSVDPEAGERFVNSSRAQCVDSLELLRAASTGRSALSEEAAVRQARELRMAVATRGQRDAHWWSLVLDELEFGPL